jgi:hypothetical protein
MWVYRLRRKLSNVYEADRFEVGYYQPGGEWVPDTSGDNAYCTAEEAAAKVHYLNGGN